MSKDPKIILEILSKNNNKVDDLYRYLYIPEFYLLAYQNIYSKPSQMTPASDGSTIDGMSLERINRLIQKLKNKTYHPTPLNRVNIPKKNGKTRPISIPSFDDKLVQEIIRMILDALYDHKFSEHSHGFRPNRSCHTALAEVRNTFKGTKWWVEGDIKGCFENINQQILLKILSERIKEQKFLTLINKFLKAGYIEKWKYHKTYSGVPQGTIIGPVLSNIYLDKLDKYIENLALEFNKGKTRRQNPEMIRVRNRIYDNLDRIKRRVNIEENKLRLEKYKKEYKELRKKRSTTDQYDPEFKKLKYVRYADNFILSVIGSHKDAMIIKDKLKNYLTENLKLTLSEEKTKVTHNREKIKFLGYEISVTKMGNKPTINGVVCLWLPYEVMKRFIIDNRFGKFVCDAQTGKPKLKAIHRPELMVDDELEILKFYNAKIKGIYNYYKMASNVCKMNGFNYICQLSFFRTLAGKYKTSCAKLYSNPRYNKRANGSSHIGITYKNKFYEFFNGPFNVVKSGRYDKDVDIIKTGFKEIGRSSLIQRLEAQQCEIDPTHPGPYEVHHIKKLKDLKGKSFWEKMMISRKRKTIVLCRTCHHKLHAGKL